MALPLENKPQGVVAWLPISYIVAPSKLPNSLDNCVWVYISTVPCLHSSIFIFLGSLTPSVQNNKLSIIFIPVIILSGNFKTASGVPTLVSTITGVTPNSGEYSTIACRFTCPSLNSLLINVL